MTAREGKAMGHANVSNLSDFFIRRLYAGGTLSVAECVQALRAKGEALHASEGDYEDDAMLAMGLEQIVHYLSCQNPEAHGYSGPRGGGPWIVPVLTVWLGKKSAVSREARRLLEACDRAPHDEHLHAVAADKLEEEGHADWALGVRTLPRKRAVYAQWQANDTDKWDCGDDGAGGEYGLFDSIRWRFAAGWRSRYRDVPRLSHITN